MRDTINTRSMSRVVRRVRKRDGSTMMLLLLLLLLTPHLRAARRKRPSSCKPWAGHGETWAMHSKLLLLLLLVVVVVVVLLLLLLLVLGIHHLPLGERTMHGREHRIRRMHRRAHDLGDNAAAGALMLLAYTGYLFGGGNLFKDN
jgi:hypothetical protein